VQLGVEDRDLDPVGDQDLAVGAADPPGQPGEAQLPQVIDYLAGAVGAAAQEAGHQGRRLSLVMPAAASRGGAQGVGQGHDPSRGCACREFRPPP
jgi:hypothetical protein